MHRPKSHFRDDSKQQSSDGLVRVLCGKMVNPQSVPVIAARIDSVSGVTGSVCVDCHLAYVRRLRRYMAVKDAVEGAL